MSESMSVLMGVAGLTPTPVFDTYWRFAVERQNVFYRRVAGHAPPWTNDPILLKYRFTNPYRAADRVSQYLIRNVIYQGDQSWTEMFFRIILFKIFNRIDTWEYLVAKLGAVTWREYSYEAYTRLLLQRQQDTAIYSAAYMMPNPALGEGSKCENHLRLIEKMMEEELPYRLVAECQTMEQAFKLLVGYSSIGPFLAFQYLIDLNYSPYLNFSENDFVVAGPGARSGIRKCFSSIGNLTEAEVIRLVTEAQSAEFARLGLTFHGLWGRNLHLIDCQNLACECDKVSRILHPDAVGIGDRHRIKQSFKPDMTRIEYMFPPKWSIG